MDVYREIDRSMTEAFSRRSLSAAAAGGEKNCKAAIEGILKLANAMFLQHGMSIDVFSPKTWSFSSAPRMRPASGKTVYIDEL